MTEKSILTTSVRAGIESDQQFGAVTPPLYLSSNFTFAGFDNPRLYDYTRSGNPTRDLLGKALGELEGGQDAVVTPSGMGAVTLLCQLLSPGDLLVAPHDCYGGTHRLFTHLARRGLFRVSFVDQRNYSVLEEVLSQKPKLVWVETPSNPLLRVYDIERICDLSHKVGAKVAVDNTFLSPVLQRPLQLGADIVVHSTTKYINGHSDSIGGAVICADQEMAKTLSWWANCLGITSNPFDSFLTLRGLRTLVPRMRQHEKNAKKIVEFLSREPLIEKVYYPGLKGHPGHETAKLQHKGHGAIVSAELSGGVENVKKFVEGLSLFSLAESLGGVESLVAHPGTMTHAGMEPEARIKAGITDGLLRFSVGIEDDTELIDDLQAGFDKISYVGRSSFL
jgi:cystathionine gamma-synthase